MKRILITGAGGSAAGNFVNALRLSNESFFFAGTDANRYHLRIAPVDARYSLPRADDPAYLDALNAVIEKEHIDFVHPQPDPEVAKLSKDGSQVRARLFLPDYETVSLCHDKMRTSETLATAGVPVPRSYHVKNEKELREAMDALHPADKIWIRAIRGAGSRASLPIKDAEQALSWIEYWRSMRGLQFEDFMVAEFLPGHEFAFQSLWINGELVTSQARERIEYLFGSIMPSGQTSTPSVARTVHRDDVNEVATAAIRAASPKPHGVFCVDLKEDAAGVPRVTEINPGRFFTTSNFFAEAGLNMPLMYVQAAFGEPLPAIQKYNPLPANLYWIRTVDVGCKLVDGTKEGWS